MRCLVPCVVVTIGLACCGPSAPPPVTSGPPAVSANPTCKTELIALPPAFAPSLPKGKELLWFAPGMFDASAPDYFTYRFRLDFEDAQSWSRETLAQLLHIYYAGLMEAVATSNGRAHAPSNTRVFIAQPDVPNTTRCTDADCAPSEELWKAKIQTTDEFVTHEALELELEIETTSNRLTARARPVGAHTAWAMPCTMVEPEHDQ